MAALKVAVDLVTLRSDVPLEFDEVFAKREAKPLIQQEDLSVDEPPESEPGNPRGEFVELGDTIPETPRSGQVAASIVVAPEPKAPAPPTALAKAERAPAPMTTVSYEQELQPRSIGAAYKLAVGLFNSRMYSRFPNAEAILAIIIRGREMGMSALTALDNFHFFDGKPAAHAHLLIARAKQHPDCEYFQYVGGDATYAEYETKSRQNRTPTRLRYTIEDAKRAGMVKPNSNWEKRPAEMLRKTCGVQLARLEYPDATAGLYALEELGSNAA